MKTFDQDPSGMGHYYKGDICKENSRRSKPGPLAQGPSLTRPTKSNSILGWTQAPHLAATLFFIFFFHALRPNNETVLDNTGRDSSLIQSHLVVAVADRSVYTCLG